MARKSVIHPTSQDKKIIAKIVELAKKANIDISGAKVRRTSSRFCLGVEHGDYNGTELFGVGTDRFIWMAYKPLESSSMVLYSGNFPDDGIIEFDLNDIPEPKSSKNADTWARFACGVVFVLKRAGYKITKGINAVIFGNIPGGGMSRSASLSLNLILSLLDANDIEETDKLRIVDLAQQVENDYIGSPCGKLDQIMILFAREGFGTYYNPKNQTVEYIPLGKRASDFSIVVMDTGTVRPGLEKSTYKMRRAECEQFVSILQNGGYKISFLADVKSDDQYEKIISQYKQQYPDLCERFKYIFAAQKRFYQMLDAWKKGDIQTVGKVFREDGIGLRDDYKISGPELETMCDIARTVPGSMGERMLGGGDKGAAGALVKNGHVKTLKKAVDVAYPQSHPDFADKYAVHICKVVDGVRVYEGLV